MSEDIRWIQRFNNFQRAYTLLRQVIEDNKNILQLEPIVKEGIIKRFEYTYELAWKTLKDKMEHDGLTIDKISPKPLFKQAFQSKYINDIEIWLRMANDRNLTTHTYSFETFNKIIKSLQQDYFPLLTNFYDDLLVAVLNEQTDE